MIDPESITHQSTLDIFRRAYMRQVGVGAEKLSYSELQDRTGILVRTLKSWRDGEAMPQVDNLLKLCSVFGPSFTDEILMLIGQGGVENIEAASHSDPICTVADLVGVTSEITDRMRDGNFCYRDKAQVAPMLLTLAHKIEEQAKAMLAELPR